MVQVMVVVFEELKAHHQKAGAPIPDGDTN